MPEVKARAAWSSKIERKRAKRRENMIAAGTGGKTSRPLSRGNLWCWPCIMKWNVTQKGDVETRAWKIKRWMVYSIKVQEITPKANQNSSCTGVRDDFESWKEEHTSKWDNLASVQLNEMNAKNRATGIQMMGTINHGDLLKYSRKLEWKRRNPFWRDGVWTHWSYLCPKGPIWDRIGLSRLTRSSTCFAAAFAVMLCRLDVWGPVRLDYDNSNDEKTWEHRLKQRWMHANHSESRDKHFLRGFRDSLAISWVGKTLKTGVIGRLSFDCTRPVYCLSRKDYISFLGPDGSGRVLNRREIKQSGAQLSIIITGQPNMTP